MRNLIISSALILVTGTTIAQQVPFSSQYYANPFVTNPAFTGNHERVNAFLTHRSQWTGITGAPQTSYLTLDGPIEAKNIGLGLNLYSDVTDITSRVGAFANYSYKLKLKEDHNLFFGVALGVINNKIDFSKAVVRDGDDPFLYTEAQSKAAFSADFGLAYTWKKLEIGVCAPQILGNTMKYKKIDDGSSYYTFARHYQGSIKYSFDVSKEKEISVYPLVMVRYATGSVFQYDGNIVLDWKKIGWVGVTYHSNNAIAMSAGLRYKNIAVGYAYDLGISKVKAYTGNTSEFLLSYTFGGGSKSDEVIKEDTKDAVVDEMIAKLKAKSDTSEAEIQRLKEAIAKLQSGEGATATKPTESLTENLMRTGNSSDFVDDNGMSMSAGFYVVIGTFSSKDNANKFRDANIIKGYNNTQIVQNHKTKVYYVFVNKFDKQTDAEAEQLKFKTEYPDTWLQKLE
ncbi:MAG: PorP/SprF family type IX secretion system membrane protein [Bacteroidetes bacterium]|nr:PorP/SprF family type IX secretion system membrane protein [Bacteroidota bacterium]